MSTIRLKFYQTTLGKKVVMAISGLVLIGFVVMHMLGNLQIFIGQKALDDYAALLHSMPAVLWGARLTLIAAVFAHFWSAMSLIRLNRAARPQRYARKVNQVSTYAAQSMRYGGVAVLFFIIYHLLHLTYGSVGPNGFVEGQVYNNVVRGFQVQWISGLYIVAQIFLALHLYHGVWSLMQTLGLNHSKYDGQIRIISTLVALVVAVGNISIPVAVLAGILKL
jgi:succinate dehydrogenase / fumarate reductase, cytochrome b subunit